MQLRIPTIRAYLSVTVVLVLNEFLSYLGYTNRTLGSLLFMAVILAALFASWNRVEYGLVILFAELFIGGKGYLYSIVVHDVTISIRIALFVTILLVWIIRYRHRWQWNTIRLPLRRSLIVLTVFVGWGIVHGLILGRGYSSVYFDANAYFFFAILVVVLTPSLNLESFFSKLLGLLAAVATVLGIKSLFSLGIFAHLSVHNLVTYYKWIRDSGVGEIAYINGNAYRVFFQSQVYGLLALFVLAPFVFPGAVRAEQRRYLIVSMTLGLTAVVISLSRSFWLAGTVGLVVAAVLGFARFHWNAKQVLAIVGSGLAMFAIAFTLMSWALNFPYPFPPSKGSETAKLIGERFVALGGEAAASSRLQLLPPLTQAISRNPLFGSGFAQTITYRSQDPRQVQSSSRGVYTTYAFEWGYLDIALKIGVLGLLAYLIVVAVIVIELWRIHTPLAFGFLVAVVAISTVHITTPYLNHPLGIGLLILAIAMTRMTDTKPL